MIFIILIFGFVFVIDFIPLIKKKKKKEIIFFSIFYIISFICLTLINFNIMIPSFINFLWQLLKKLGISYYFI